MFSVNLQPGKKHSRGDNHSLLRPPGNLPTPKGIRENHSRKEWASSTSKTSSFASSIHKSHIGHLSLSSPVVLSTAVTGWAVQGFDTKSFNRRRPAQALPAHRRTPYREHNEVNRATSTCSQGHGSTDARSRESPLERSVAALEANPEKRQEELGAINRPVAVLVELLHHRSKLTWAQLEAEHLVQGFGTVQSAFRCASSSSYQEKVHHGIHTERIFSLGGAIYGPNCRLLGGENVAFSMYSESQSNNSVSWRSSLTKRVKPTKAAGLLKTMSLVYAFTSCYIGGYVTVGSHGKQQFID